MVQTGHQADVYELSSERTLRVKKEVVQMDFDDGHFILCRTLYSAISVGTELAAWRGDPPLRPSLIYPRVVGYCNVAEIVAIGSEVRRFSIGDYVLTFQSHRSVFSCSESDVITSIPKESDLPSIATSYLFHLGYNAMLRCNFVPGCNIAIVGLGTIGLATVAMLSRFGGKAHAFSGRNSARSLALTVGAVGSWDKSDPYAVKGALDYVAPGGFDIVINTSNSWADWKLSLKLCRKFGTIGVVGFPGRAQTPPDFNPLSSEYVYDKQLTIVGCGQSPDYDIPAHDMRFTVKRNCQYIMNQIVNGNLPARKLIFDILPWSLLGDIYRVLEDKNDSGLTRVLDWQIS